MKIKNKIRKISSLKLYPPEKTKKYKMQTTKSIKDFIIKLYNIHINEQQKLSSLIINTGTNLKKFQKSRQNDNIFNYNYIPNEEKNKIFQTEKFLKKENTYEEDDKRKISIDNTVNLSNKIPRTKLSLTKRKINNKLSLSILSLNTLNTKLYFNQKIKNEKQNYTEREEKTDTLTLSSMYQNSNSYNHKRPNIKNMKNYLNKKSFKELKGLNTINSINKKSHKNLLNEIQKNLIKTLSDISYTINNDYKNKNKLYKNIDNNLQKTKSLKIISHNTLDDYDSKCIKKKHSKKSLKNIFDVNKIENNNIFLDKNYQNRFNHKTKSTKLKNDIFTNEKQKEYNTIIVKKKSNNHSNNLVTISTTNSSNNSSNNNTTINNHNHNWVHRLYDEEINKQKMRDKMIYLLRKSILNDVSPNKSKKKIKKIKEYEFNYKKKFDENFNIINLFLSDEKKLKNKRNKRYKKYKKDNKPKNTNIRNIIKLNEYELNISQYNIALKYDKRNFFQYYWSLVKSNNILFFAFIPSNDYNSQTIKLCLFLFSFSQYYTISALFFNESSLHIVYEQNGIYNLIDQIPQIFYSSIISSVINLLIRKFSLTDKSVIKIKNDRNNKSKIKEFFRCLKIKFILFFIISFLFLILFWYYIGCFCAVYENTQLFLIKDTLISFGFSLMYPFAFYLLPAIFRIISLRSKKNMKCMYNFSKVFQFIF